MVDAQTDGASRFFYCPKATKKERGEDNKHPTVKPIALMRWLVRLVTPLDGVVLDPFCGSGSTLLAAAEEGVGFIGVDISPEYCGIALRRLKGRKA
jgi:site-specific DNA-methyltransferase (adenine-specific)